MSGVWRQCALALALCALAMPEAVHAQGGGPQFRYDTEYPAIGYGEEPSRNRVAALIARLESGEADLEYAHERGYLGSLLAALDIDPSSQVLVYSKTSLQYPLISADTPRALYFNDDVYIGWVRESDIIEIAAMDAEMGPVFYTFHNAQDEAQPFLRETGRCLNCHDTQGMMGGGVPILPVRSNLVNRKGAPLTTGPTDMTTDSTPLAERWGGWYVTGAHGGQTHLGNLLIDSSDDIPDIAPEARGNLETLDAHFDTAPYLADTSDIVALMVMEHQLAVQNQIAYVRFKAPTVLQRVGEGQAVSARSWDELPEPGRRYLTRMMDELAGAILMEGAVTLDEPIAGNSGFDAWFQAQSAPDSLGRSFRELDLRTRLFARPVSFVIQSEAFDALPPYAIDYVYRRIADVLTGRDDGPEFAHLTEEDRAEALDMLIEAKPAFAAYAEAAAD